MKIFVFALWVWLINIQYVAADTESLDQVECPSWNYLINGNSKAKTGSQEEYTLSVANENVHWQHKQRGSDTFYGSFGENLLIMSFEQSGIYYIEATSKDELGCEVKAHKVVTVTD